MDYVIKCKSADHALAGMAMLGLTTVDAKGARTIRTSGLTVPADMEMLALAVDATMDRVAKAEPTVLEVEAARIDFQRAEKIAPRSSMTEWVMHELGQRMIPSGEVEKDPFGNERPVMVPDDGYWLILRWNGDAPPPPLPPGIEVAWSSASLGVDAQGFPLPAPEYPSGLPRFA